MTRMKAMWFDGLFRRSRIQGRPHRALLAVPVCLGLLVAACGMAVRPTGEASREEMDEFRELMLEDSEKTVDYIRKTENGINISDLTLGWFVYDVLTELSSQDEVLFDYFNNEGIDLQTYLKTRFHDDPRGEIAALGRLAQQGHPTLRLAARAALETLRHIPNPDEPAEIQRRDRAELAGALANLRDLLEINARAVALP